MKALLVVLIGFIAVVSSGQSFTEITGTSLENVVDGAIAFTDVDGDGDPDLMITGENSNTSPNAKLYINDGNGNFTDEGSNVFDRVRNSAIKFFDADNDTDQDLLITGINNSFSRIAKLYLNDGTGGFSDSNQVSLIGAQDGDIAVADIDGDNDLDLLISGRTSPADPNSITSRLYTNDGNGNFAEKLDSPLEGVYNGSVAFADIDKDDDQDLLITGENGADQSIAKLYINDGNGLFTESLDHSIIGVRNSAVAFVDIDNDTDQDLLVTGWNGTTQTKMYINNGDGIFVEKEDFNVESVSTGDVAIVDIDNDDDHDILLTGTNSNGRFSNLYLNNGVGDFIELSTGFDNVWLSSIALADIDGDNDKDVLISGENASNQRVTRLYENKLSTSIVETLLLQNSDLSIFPNPVSKQEVSIKYDSFQNGKLQLEIYNFSGSKYYSQTFQVLQGDQTLTFQLPTLPSGSYFLRLSQSEYITHHKIIIN